MLVAGRTCPGRIAVIGGGRWARVLTDVLCELVSPSVVLSVHSRHNASAMSAWVAAKGFAERVHVSSDWPAAGGGDAPGAVIVANAARDHEQAVERSVLAGVPVLVEKPMALTSAVAKRLIGLARERQVPLASAQVFRFARYVDRFAKDVAAAGGARWVRVDWTDPYAEQRYGELKQHDATLPIATDLLPHVLSLVNDVVPVGPDRCERAVGSREGLELKLDLVFDALPCHVWLARQSDARRRVVEAGVAEGIVRLDFSTEPGTVTCGINQACGDPEWTSRPRPLASLLAAFLECAAGGEADGRLGTDLAVRACELSDQTMVRLEGGR